MKSPALSAVAEELKLLSVVMPARDEEGVLRRLLSTCTWNSA